MRITWLLESTDQIWGGVKVALEDANWLARRGHQVTVVSRSGPPTWMQLACEFRRVQDFHGEHLPDADVLVATFWTTVPWAASAGAGKGAPVHFCQGYEGDNPEQTMLRDRIEAAYRLPGVQHITIAPHLTQLLQQRFGITAHEIVYAIDHGVHFPAAPRPVNRPLRVGLVGPYQVAWKDLATGFAACDLAHRAGQALVLVRATNTAPAPAELTTSFPVEWHRQLPPARMGDYYRSLDVVLGTSSGAEEGFFLPAIEAMACGVPAVLTSVPCFRDHAARVGDDGYALFVPAKDPAAMAEALVLAGSLAPVRETLRHRGIALAGHYRQELHGEQLERTLGAIAGADRAPLRLLRDPAPPAGGTDAELDQTTARLHQQAGRWRECGNLLLAARALEAAHCLAPDDAVRLAEAADAALAAGAHATALRLYDLLAATGDDSESLHQGRGMALHALGRIQAAAQSFRAALAVGVRCADAYNRLGVVLFQAGDVAGARDSFERALALQPDHGDASANLQALPAA
jgi:glycosyltransferase involved in cell wall biosynthesis